ncbi:MAG: hypothetical protein A3E51_22390 [Burkholderiales bacterium RIFCSPHIGHO2_12_FULL_67_38]|nr:MAG: hypothetical protein A2W81_05235 [Betaproteobacteria bacterium RIFCSPLOWO2_12_61_14]OGB17732.1 MAG: hypothetical protein A3I64_12710 [Burkholderiales bacterium RIFCSPLOWO2_02_FULL_67_64]OGB43315.1 MAG: hypothetical protein A3E51_22390 [Burkholderiales bacterium RIFCSPHIGHO2_12_FULL_67_38]
MKKLAIIAFAAFATSAFADPEIVIDGVSFQSVAAVSSIFHNEASGDDAYAQQNVSSNSGNVTVSGGGTSYQQTSASGSVVANLAYGDDAYASQNVSSNIGDVTINGYSWQATALYGSGVYNIAGEDTQAVQNIASNNGCVACVPKSSHGGH